jgi:alkylation response protein AidB-like acyl-CoA dehydrogenase
VDFELTDDQQELQRVVHDVVERECTPALVRSVLAGGDDAERLWKTFVDLDWPSLSVPEADGGMGFGAVELALTLEELGWAADPTAFLATTSQYVPLVRECAPDDLRRPLLAAVCAGTTGTATFAADEITARRDGDGWILDGTARFVLDADRAHELAVVAGHDNGDAGVFVVRGRDVTATRIAAFDGSMHIAHVELTGARVPADRAFPGHDVAAGVARARDEAVTGLAATMVGASQHILELVLEHVKHRHQFGVPIGSFQAVKHMAVDVFVAIQRARALYQFAALAIAEDDTRRTMAASMAKAAAGDCQRIAARHGIQLFGGLGFTWENDLQLYVRRAKVGELLLGTSVEHRTAVGRAALAASP